MAGENRDGLAGSWPTPPMGKDKVGASTQCHQKGVESNAVLGWLLAGWVGRRWSGNESKGHVLCWTWTDWVAVAQGCCGGAL